MYHRMVRRAARRAFVAVNRHDYDILIGLCHPTVIHRFGGRHALGGVRRDAVALRAWFERLGRVMPSLEIFVTDLWVKGGPWKTVVVMRWTATGRPLDGAPYANHGVHVIEMRWGKVVSIDANEDSQAVDDVLRRQARCGIGEALAAPIES